MKLFGRRLWGEGKGEADHIKVKESTKGEEISDYRWTERKNHPNNMTFYEGWSRDPEADAALTILSKLIAGVGFHTLVVDKKGEADENHAHKLAVDAVAEELNFDEKTEKVAWQSLAKGFTPTELDWGSDGQLDEWKILPSETFYIYRSRKGVVQKYTQEESMKEVTSWGKNELEDIVLFYNHETPMRPYGTSLLDSIGTLLDMRKELNTDVKKGVHRWANPIPILETSKSKANSTALKTSLEEREPDEWVLVYDVTEGELRWQPLTVEPSARFVPYVELIYNQIAEGLHAPLLLYLKNATEASAHVVMESVDRLVEGRQRHIKRRMERRIYAGIVRNKQPIPRHVWGKPRTGLEKVTFTELSMMLNSPSLAYNQKEWLLKQYSIKLPAPDWKSGPPPELMQPFAPMQTPKPREKQVPYETIIQKINDLNTTLNIIYENHHAGNLTITKACQQAERAISVHLQRAYPTEWQQRKEAVFKTFVKERLMKVQAK